MTWFRTEELPGETTGTGESDLRIGELLEGDHPDQAYGVVVVDCEALPRLGPTPFLREEDWRFLAGALEAGGCLVFGGIGSLGDRSSPALEALALRATEWFAGVSLYRARNEILDPDLLPEMGENQFVLVCTSPGDPAWSFFPDGFDALPAAKG